MAYAGDGSYLAELEAEHRQGLHQNNADSYCQLCRDRGDRSDEQHEKGRHKKGPVKWCTHCSYEEEVLKPAQERGEL